VLREVNGEVDRTHDSVSEFFVDQFLQRLSVHVDRLAEAVDSRVGGQAGVGDPIRLPLERGGDVGVEFESCADCFRALFRHRMLAEQGCDRPHQGFVNGLGQFLPGHPLRPTCFVEHLPGFYLVDQLVGHGNS